MYSNLDDQPREIGTGIPASIRARVARFNEEQTAKADTAKPPSEPVYTMAEMQMVLKQEMYLYRREIDQRLGRMEQMILSALPAQNIALVNELRHRLDKLEKTGPTDPCSMFPSVERITKMKVQIFHNTGKGRVAKRLKFYVWTCPLDQCAKQLEGTCGDFFMNMADPKHRSYRRYIGDALDYLNARDAKLVGALSLGKSQFDQRKCYDQAAIIMPDDHLYVDLYGQRLDFGMMRSAADDWEPNAAKGLWQYPDLYG